MKFIGDFHIHSHYSRATSSQLTPEHLDYWARRKGITVVGTGDFTHPGWSKELEEKLEPAEEGLFKLKKEFTIDDGKLFADGRTKEVRFLLTAEISNIYKKNERVRKVHNVVFAPDFETVKKIQQRLQNLKCNITSDGRPIIGMDSRNLLELCLEGSPKIFFVPAHIWTPWFSVLGSKSGFDTIEECYGDLTFHIHAVETGLSSDAPMNWMCGFLDKFTLISNSDAHSPEKLGRNANRFDTELNYKSITDALTTGDSKNFLGTIDLFPQEGKYHFDGHRNCAINWSPLETVKHKGLCSKCGKPVTVGVMNRVAELADRDNIELRKNRAPFISIIPLREMLSEILGVSGVSKKVDEQYHSMIQKIGPELEILIDTPIDIIREKGSEILAEAVHRMRNREVVIEEGYDGEFGKISVFGKNEIKKGKDQDALFAEKVASAHPESRGLLDFDLAEYRALKKLEPVASIKGSRVSTEKADISLGKKKKSGIKMSILKELNSIQLQAAQYEKGAALVLAGPGTGKTRVLTSRIAYLLHEKKQNPQNILAVTFTRKAANEMRERLEKLVDSEMAKQIRVQTFHAFGYTVLKKLVALNQQKKNETESFLPELNNFFVLTGNDREKILREKLKLDTASAAEISKKIAETKEQLLTFEKIKDRVFAQVFQKYQNALTELNALDFDDLIYRTIQELENNKELLEWCRDQFKYILVDEYQDINFAQYQLLRKLMPEKNSNLFVIGDPNQSIYGFRGANTGFIARFKEEYPDAKVFELDQSYRCPTTVLRASGNMLGINPLKGIHKGVKIKITEYSSDSSEAECIARKVENLIGGMSSFSMNSNVTDGHENEAITSLSDFAVLVRTKAQMQKLEKAFHDHNIPYQTVGDVPFFQEEPMRTIIDLLRVYQHPENEFLRKKLGNPEVLDQQEIDGQTKKTVKEKLQKIIDWQIKEKKIEQESCSENAERLFTIAEDFGTNVDAFLEYIQTSLPADDYLHKLERVAIMTLHASKGLEFPCVFIAGVEEGIIPFAMREDSPSDTEEERRLLYVGMTRAQKFLYLSHAEQRFFYGQELHLRRSSFLDKIEKTLLEQSREGRKEKRTVKLEQPTLF